MTALSVPERRAADVDLLALGVGSLAALSSLVDDLLADPTADGLPIPEREETWTNTPLPGLRLRFGDALQVDLGFGDPLAAPPVRAEVEGVPVLVVPPEVMAGWKAHGIVEHGRGRFRAKDLWDLRALLERVRPFDDDLFARSLALAFSSRGTPLSELDPLLHDMTWGQGRSSRRKWRSFTNARLVPGPLPGLDEVVASLRASLAPVVARLTGSPRGR